MKQNYTNCNISLNTFISAALTKAQAVGQNVILALGFFTSGIFCSVNATAQLNPGVNTSSWGGVSNVNWNPAIANPKYAADINLGLMNVGMVSNHTGFNATTLFTMTSWKDILTINMPGNDIWNGSGVSTSPMDGKLRNINQFVQLQGPGSFMFPFGKTKKNALAVTYHLNSGRTIVGLDETLAYWSDPNRPLNMNSVAGANTNFSITSAAWLDYGVTYSRVLLDKGKHFFKIGVTGKLLHSLGTATIQANSVNYDYNNLGSASAVTFGPQTFSVSQNNSAAFSFGGDLGVVYEFRPKKDKYRYQMDSLNDILPKFKDLHTLAIGFSIIDMGALPTGNSVSSDYTLSAPLTTGTLNFFDTHKMIDSISGHGVASAYSGSSKIILPTRFNLFVDYNIAKGFGLNLNASISPVFSSSSPQISYGSHVALTPRFDLPMFGAYLPVNVNFNGKVGVGLTLRAGPVWVGVSDFVGMATGVQNGVFFGGLKIPIYYHKQKDKDRDMVSDKFDLCQFQKGSWTTQGCADKDGDGVRDSLDQCPNDKGLAKYAGCPDTDGDGVIDKEDSCVNTPGQIEKHGCPDSDNDGIIDKDDVCPTVAGIKQFFGCPDTDGDGVADKDDKCKTVKGEIDHYGCPDTDKDGVYDYEDDDPLVPGPVENHGKPYDDSDGDGIPDNEDKCKFEKGIKEYKGCATPPKINAIAEINSTYDTLFFESNKSEVLNANYMRVKTFAQKMLAEEQKKNNIVLYGNTDNVETDPSSREALSLSRANAVRDALVSNGIDAKRIEVYGNGDSQPAGDNANPVTRRKNRRVEIHIVVVTD